MQKKEVLTLTATLIASVIFITLAFGVDFDTTIDLQFHDTYFEIHPVYFIALVWLIFNFVTFLLMAVRNRFMKKSSLWVLVISNTILIILTAAFTYYAYAVFVTYLLIDIFRETPQTEMISNQINKTLIIGISIFAVFMVSEYFLIRRLIQLRKNINIESNA
jgi:hypothetical protein